MRGVKCSWKEMTRLHKQVLPALARGDGKKYAELRCVAKQAVDDWKRTSDVMAVLDRSGSAYADFDYFQPSHAREIARHFRKQGKPETWGDDLKEQIVDWVDRCEADELTVPELRKLLKRERDAQLKADNPLPEGKYDLIYVDPPWRYEYSKSDSRAIESHYDSMDLDDIKGLAVGDMLPDNCVLFMWATSPKLQDALEVVEAWGFTYRTNAVWVKDKIGMGYYFRQQHELLLVATVGSPAPPAESDRPSSVIMAPRREHSEKPLAVYEILEAMYPSFSKIELFARTSRTGWTQWGEGKTNTISTTA